MFLSFENGENFQSLICYEYSCTHSFKGKLIFVSIVRRYTYGFGPNRYGGVTEDRIRRSEVCQGRRLNVH